MTAKKRKTAPRKTAKLATTKPEAKKAKAPAAWTKDTPIQQWNPEHKIHLLAKENPKRKGSKEAKRFSLYKNGMAVQAAKDAGMGCLAVM